MYQTLLKDFDNRQRELMLENVELRKVLQQIKKEMISILSPKQSSWREVRQEHCENQVSDFTHSPTILPRSAAAGLSVWIFLACCYVNYKTTTFWVELILCKGIDIVQSIFKCSIRHQSYALCIMILSS